MNHLAIFDIDGTLTDTTGVDDECYREAVAEALGVPPGSIDWSGAADMTDSGILHWLFSAHGRPAPTASEVARAKGGFVERLVSALETHPARFAPVAGALSALHTLERHGWRAGLATGCWEPSARLKLDAARIRLDDKLLACADDAMSRAEIVRLAQARAEQVYDCTFERVVSVGDGPWDVQTAAVLGLPFIGIATGARAELLRSLGAETVLADYADLDRFQAALLSATVPETR